jgi:hypothetical protein
MELQLAPEHAQLLLQPCLLVLLPEVSQHKRHARTFRPWSAPLGAARELHELCRRVLLGHLWSGPAGNGKDTINVAAAGFSNVDEKVWKVPLGVWPQDAKIKTIGLYCQTIIYDGLRGISMGPLKRRLG